MSTITSEKKFTVSEFGVLFALIAVSIFIRDVGDRASSYINAPYLTIYYPEFVSNQLPKLHFWSLLLPLPQIKGTWCTTGFILNYELEYLMGSDKAYYFLVVISTLTFYIFLRTALSSPLISIIGASFLMFSRYNEHAYIVWGSNNTYNLTIFISICCIAGLHIWRHGLGWVNGVVFVVALIAAASAYEAWINFALAALWMWVAVAVFLWRSGKNEHQWRLAFMGTTICVTFVVYIVVRSQYAELTFRDGTEAQLLTTHFNWQQFSIIIDDLTNNVMLNFFMTVTQVLPPGFGHSAHILHTGGYFDAAATTSGYLKQMSGDIDWMMKAHYWLMWRFWAGALFAVGAMLAFRWAKKAWLENDWGALLSLCLLIPVLMGSPSHALLKVVHWTTWPQTPYKISVSMLSLLTLTCFLLREALCGIASKRTHYAIGSGLILYAIVSFLVAPRVYNAHIRFAWGERGLFHQGFYPDAISGLESFARVHVCSWIPVRCES